MNVGSRGWNEGGPAACQRESWIKSWETIGRQKCGKVVRDYDRERRCRQPVGIVEKELVKRDYRTVLEAYGGTR